MNNNTLVRLIEKYPSIKLSDGVLGAFRKVDRGNFIPTRGNTFDPITYEENCLRY